MPAEDRCADASSIDGLRAPGVADAIAKAPGRVGHTSDVAALATGTPGCGSDDTRAEPEDRVAPNLPDGAGPITPEPSIW